jgi:hypothetical protein
MEGALLGREKLYTSVEPAERNPTTPVVELVAKRMERLGFEIWGEIL